MQFSRITVQPEKMGGVPCISLGEEEIMDESPVLEAFIAETGV